MTTDSAYRPIIRRATVALAALAIVVGVCFRSYDLGGKTFWGDEILGVVRMLGYTEAEIVSAGPSIRTADDVQAYFRLSGPRNTGPRPLVATVQSLASEDPQHPPAYYLMG